jgi:hypothetical protein
LEAEKAHDEGVVVVATEGLRSIPANGWPEWDLSYVEKSAGKMPAVRKAK